MDVLCAYHLLCNVYPVDIVHKVFATPHVLVLGKKWSSVMIRHSDIIVICDVYIQHSVLSSHCNQKQTLITFLSNRFGPL